MSNNLHYAAAQVAPYLVAASWCLRQVSLDSTGLAASRAEWDELRKKVLGLEKEKQKFGECYDLMAGEKTSVEEQVENLDGSVERFSQRIEALVEEKKVLGILVEE